MAHFAELNDENFVTRVIVVNNNELLDAEGEEQETIGIAFCQKLFGGNWVQTSYNASFRKTFATVGSYYDEDLDHFVPPNTLGVGAVFNRREFRWELDNG
jgi:hypothetical protein